MAEYYDDTDDLEYVPDPDQLERERQHNQLVEERALNEKAAAEQETAAAEKAQQAEDKPYQEKFGKTKEEFKQDNILQNTLSGFKNQDVSPSGIAAAASMAFPPSTDLKESALISPLAVMFPSTIM